MKTIKITIDGKTIDAQINEEDLATKKKKNWEPKSDEEYWRYSCYYNKVVKVNNYDQEETDDDILFDNCFRTKEEAEKNFKHRKALKRIKDYIIENDMEFEPDWENEKQYKFHIDYNYHKSEYDTDWCNVFRYLLVIPYLSCEEHARKVIKDCKDDLDILFDFLGKEE